MNDEEIMKKFNETFSDDKAVNLEKKKETVTPYKAVTNQNIVSTSAVVPTATNNGIPPLNNQNNVVNNGSNVSNTSVGVNGSLINNSESKPSNVNYNYVPTLESKKKKTVSFKLNKDIIPVFVIVIILLVAMFFIPDIVDLFTKV